MREADPTDWPTAAGAEGWEWEWGGGLNGKVTSQQEPPGLAAGREDQTSASKNGSRREGRRPSDDRTLRWCVELRLHTYNHCKKDGKKLVGGSTWCDKASADSQHLVFSPVTLCVSQPRLSHDTEAATRRWGRHILNSISVKPGPVQRHNELISWEKNRLISRRSIVECEAKLDTFSQHTVIISQSPGVPSHSGSRSLTQKAASGESQASFEFSASQAQTRWTGRAQRLRPSDGSLAG